MSKKISHEIGDKTYRLHRTDDSTLRGYIFMDADHAVKWLSQNYLHDSLPEMSLMPITITKLMQCCSRCKQEHLCPDFEVTGSAISALDFLDGQR